MCLFNLILILVINISSQTVIKSYKTWNEGEKLNWEDFKGKFEKNDKYSAESGLDLYYELKYRNEDSVEIVITAVFFPFQSSYASDQTREDLLRHEQLHFDIVELFARKFRQKIVLYNDHFTYLQLKKVIDIESQKLKKELDIFQDQYDAETGHSLYINSQEEWNKNILLGLDSLKNYNWHSIKINTIGYE